MDLRELGLPLVGRFLHVHHQVERAGPAYVYSIQALITPVPPAGVRVTETLFRDCTAVRLEVEQNQLVADIE